MRLVLFAAAIALAGCQMSSDSMEMTDADPIMTTLSGKKLTNVNNDEQVIFLNADGSLTGVAEGNWTIRDGQYCRTLTKPAQLAGTECQDVKIDGNQATFMPQGRPSSTWTVSDA